jgi:hypothetical protein
VTARATEAAHRAAEIAVHVHAHPHLARLVPQPVEAPVHERRAQQADRDRRRRGARGARSYLVTTRAPKFLSAPALV